MPTSAMFRRLLLHKCTISTWTNSADDGFGQPTKSWTDLVTAQPCRLNTNETGRPYEAIDARTGNIVLAEFQVWLPLNASTWDFTNKRPMFSAQARMTFSWPINLTLNVELVAERAARGHSNHLEVYCNRANP